LEGTLMGIPLIDELRDRAELAERESAAAERDRDAYKQDLVLALDCAVPIGETDYVQLVRIVRDIIRERNALRERAKALEANEAALLDAITGATELLWCADNGAVRVAVEKWRYAWRCATYPANEDYTSTEDLTLLEALTCAGVDLVPVPEVPNA
jgi:hypothetical protein